MGATAPIALRNRCPACGALPGNRCIDDEGIMDTIHAAREHDTKRFQAHDTIQFVDRVVHLNRGR